ncbi:MAG: ABC transporter ATP-binding protein [Bacilli bacterium]|nr:ABC transporter ATP-binding protein [Bacilli bacterium]
MPRIELINVTKRWGHFVAVDNLTMVIEDREFVTLLGPSGCGKTTTLRMIAGLETPTSGKIIIGDRVVFDSDKGINISASNRDIGFLFQNYALWPHMTVYKNISFGLENLKWKKEDIKNRVDEVMKTLQISEFRDRYPSELSGGQQQRVAIARTLAPKPQVLFMDEPLSNLDAKLRGEMRTELKRLHRDTDSTFVYVTHDQLEAMTLATRTCLIHKGLMQQYDKPLNVYNHPTNLFVADFVGSPTMNFLKAKAKKVSEKVLHLEVLDIKIKYTSNEIVDLKSENVIIGIRPEFLLIKDDGSINGLAYSTLPSGMETTVKINLKDTILSAVQFGAVDYAFDQKINFDIIGKGIVLFDEESKVSIALGSCEVIK